ncbi:MAG: rane protein, partial [Bacilli bacterium]|nr:rane protein [Bacilli bacterium]
MNEISVERTPHTIATQIYGIKGQARQVILYSSVEIGRLLVEAKSLVAHGEWGDWLKNSVDYSQSTANNLMQLYREYGDSSDKLQNLSYTKAIALLGVPADEREDFIAVNDIESMSSRDLLQAIKDKQLLEEQLQESNTAQQELAKKLKDTEKRSRDRSLEVERLKTEISGAQESGNK